MGDDGALRAEVRDFLRTCRDDGVFEPVCDSWLRGHSPRFSRMLGERGWLGMTWPKEYGGHERTAAERFVVIEELLAAGAPVAAHWIADRQTGPLLLRFGTEEQRRTVLPGIARGEVFAAIGMSEPDSGSDLASIRTRAERDGAGWRVTGRKIWTSHAHRSHYAVTLVRTAPRSEDRHAGLSQFLIDLSSPGIEIRPIKILTGEEHFTEVVLDGVYVPDERVVGTVGGGWAQVMAELAYERSGPERFLSTYPLVAAHADAAATLPDAARADLGDLVARLWALRTMSVGVTGMLQRGESPNTRAALIKDMGTALERESIETVRRAWTHPGAPAVPAELGGLLAEAQLAAPAFTLRGGTNEILRGVVARSLGVR
ncbi:MAG TPA: acyl-CoA dehydrogenase family protein [Streptosporangiaceae bacterium]